jgi:hypothetical protein
VRQQLHAFGIIVVALALSGRPSAQDPASAQKPSPPAKPAAAASTPAGLYVPIRLQFVIAKYEGEKKISSLPYSISLNANGPRVSLRMGVQVPIANTQVTEGKTSRSFSYRDVGVSIDSNATSHMDTGQFRVDIVVEDSSISSNTPGQDSPVFRHFRTSNTVLLKDGQTSQLTTAADPISGEMMRVDVTLNVVK